MDVINDFIRHFAAVKYADIPAPAVAAAKQEVLDSLATALGGSSREGIGELVDMMREWGGTEQGTIIGYDFKCPTPNAAQVNATMIHALDYDDGHQVGLVHIGCVAVATCFAVAERMGKVSGKELLRALVLGEDFLARLGLATRPGKTLIAFGWHPTSLFGYLGAAAMAGILMGLDETKMSHALGIAYHQCAGNIQCGIDGSLTKRMAPGLSAHGGITAALMAERGITGVRNTLEGKAGMYNLYHDGDYDRERLIAGLGEVFEGVNIGDKPYPCCGFTHVFIDAGLALLAKHDIEPQRIREIRVYAGESSYGLCAPGKEAPQTIVDAQFSVPWTVATTLVKGRVSVNDFTEAALGNKDVLAAAAKVQSELNTAYNRHGVSPGRVTVVMDDGTEYTEEIMHCLGSQERPMTFEDCAVKFRECAAAARKPLPPAEAEETIGLIARLDELDDAAEIIRRLA